MALKTRKNIKSIYLKSNNRYSFHDKTKSKTKTKSKSKSKSKTKSKSKSKTSKSIAGEAFASGGFGCVFRPQLKCTNDTSRLKNKGVSKLMLKKYQNVELKEVEIVKNIVKNIKNYKHYFLIDNIQGCLPDKLTKTDKVNFDKKCKNLVKKGITEKNVNNRLDKLGIIQLPYGGKTMDEYFTLWNLEKQSKKKTESFIQTNNTLIKLFKYGILSLQKNKYIHMDVKGSNILRITDTGDDVLSVKNIKTRIIDWGLSVNYSKENKHTAPRDIYNGPIQYNTPFSTILFNTHLTFFIKQTLYNISKKQEDRHLVIKTLAASIYKYSLDNIGEGHNAFILQILNKIYTPYLISKNHAELSALGKNTIVEYLAVILDKYIDKNNNFNDGKYFHEVYCKNVDTWGFLMSYLDIIDLNKNHLLRNQLEQAVSNILKEYCFSTKYACRPIPYNNLIADLTKLNRLV